MIQNHLTNHSNKRDLSIFDGKFFIRHRNRRFFPTSLHSSSGTPWYINNLLNVNYFVRQTTDYFKKISLKKSEFLDLNRNIKTNMSDCLNYSKYQRNFVLQFMSNNWNKNKSMNCLKLIVNFFSFLLRNSTPTYLRDAFTYSAFRYWVF